jgi:hypothetical protein
MTPQVSNQKKLSRLYQFGYAFGFIYLMVMVWMLVLIRPSIYNSKGSVSESKRTIYGAVTGTVFLIDSLGLLWSTLHLIKRLKRDFSNQLSEESATLKRLFVIFTISYLLRTVLLLP